MLWHSQLRVFVAFLVCALSIHQGLQSDQLATAEDVRQGEVWIQKLGST